MFILPRRVVYAGVHAGAESRYRPVALRPISARSAPTPAIFGMLVTRAIEFVVPALRTWRRWSPQEFHAPLPMVGANSRATAQVDIVGGRSIVSMGG